MKVIIPHVVHEFLDTFATTLALGVNAIHVNNTHEQRGRPEAYPQG